MKYEDIFTFVNLIKAHRKVRRSKLHKNEVVEFELNKSHELYKLYEELNRKTYQISPYRTFYIYEPKKRRVDATPYRDRVVQNCFVDNYLFPLLENRLIYDNAACKKNKGTDFARNRLKAFLLDAYKKYGLNFYVLTFDIHHYFESINHNILKDKIRKIIKNKEILEFVLMVIDSFNKDTNVGVPLGNQTSQCFALYYLDNFDRVIKEKYRIQLLSYKFLQKDTTKRSKSFAFKKTRDFSFNYSLFKSLKTWFVVIIFQMTRISFLVVAIIATFVALPCLNLE